MASTHKRVSGLSGNEIFCLNLLKMRAGQLCIGNSVVSIGVGRGLGAGLSTLGGGEVSQITNLVKEGRTRAFDRMLAEAKANGGVGLTGVSFDLVNHSGNLEFITSGSSVHASDAPEALQFSTSSDAQELFCQMDAGFQPLSFVFGNVAYSIGVGGSIGGAFSKLKRGEVPQYTQIFDLTRHLALNRLIDHARQHGANAVLGIETTITLLMGAQEMMMVGTASRHPALPADGDQIVTSAMTNQELWNMANLGYMPVRLVMGVSVYSLGFVGGVFATLRSLTGGEVQGLTDLLYEAREQALARVEADAERWGADEVVNVKTRVYDLGGGLVEFLAIGTAVKKMPGARTQSSAIPPQVVIQDRDMFVDATSRIDFAVASKDSARKTQAGPLSIIVFFLVIAFYVFKMVVLSHLAR